MRPPYLAVLLVACSTASVVPTPDPTGPSGASSTSASSSTSTASSGTSGSSVTSSSSVGAGGGGSSAVSTGAGGAPPMKGSGYESGNRLRARYYQGADGSKQAFGWHDSMLNADCAAAVATDGKTRCLPPVTTPVSLASTSLWSDASCSAPIVFVPQVGCSPGSYATGYQNGTCSPGAHLFAVGAQVKAADSIYSGPGGPIGCAKISSSAVISAQYDAYFTGPELDPTTFVEMTPMVE